MDDTLLIDEHRLEKLCISIARTNNELARKLGQLERLSPSELMDLYYAQKGLCALTGLRLEFHENLKHYRRIQLDHIVEKRAREAEKRLLAGESGYVFGKVACITNVQWVCRFANMIKEYVRASGADYTSLISAMNEQCTNRFPLRNNASFLGNSGRRAFREQIIRKAISENPHISAPSVVELLAGTIGESAYPVVLNHMKEIGWKGSRDTSISELQKASLIAVVAANGLEWNNWNDLLQQFNREAVSRGLREIKSLITLRSVAAKTGIAIVTRRTAKVGRRACPGDGAAFLKMLKAAGASGTARQSCRDWFLGRNVPEIHCDHFIQQMLLIGCVYESADGTHLIAAMTRKEAAEKIGVSKNRLKKWGRMDWAGGVSGPAYIKASVKGHTYYKHEDVDDFIAEREPHRLDLSQCGQRQACVDGGMLGGRPRGQLLQNATA